MFTLIRWAFSILLFLVVVWFATTVPIGKHTLWGHLSAIFSTQEAKDLADGAKEEAKKIADRVREERARGDGGAARHTREPLDPVDDGDRKKLDKLVRDKSQR
ncbi:MAG TPA: hypothetical protein VMZ28_10990 [Kofleriaceae bacterium]|nr:hypothetical protein [Kofleriaceae bacterium]